METNINSLRSFDSPASFSAMVRAQAVFKETANMGWGNMDIILFLSCFFELDIQITNP